MTAALLTIRRLTAAPADLDALDAIEGQSFNKYDAYTRADFVRWLGYDPRLCFAAELGGRMAAYLIARVWQGAGDLASLAADPACRRSGAGRALLAALEYELLARQVTVVTLEVRPSNLSGRAFWRRQGFYPFGIFDHFYADGEDAIRMRKDLSKPDCPPA
jgi:ribosomal protein S18 acetylase RimI-like enzyme